MTSADQLLRDNFSLVDTDGDGFVSRDEVLLLFRGLGQTPRDSVIQSALAKLPERTDFEEFKKFFKTNYREPVGTEQLTAAFAVFDPFKTGFINVSKFRDLVTSIADSLTHAEVDEVLRISGFSEKSEIPYAAFAKSLALGPAN